MQKFPRRYLKLRIEVQVLRISEWRQHTTEVGSDVLHDEREGHVFFLPALGQDKIAERKKGQKRHVVGNEHGADKRNADEGQHSGAHGAEAQDDAARQNGEKPDVFQRTDDAEGAEQAGERFQIKVGKIGAVRRDEKGRDHCGKQGNAEDRVLADKRTATAQNMVHKTDTSWQTHIFVFTFCKRCATIEEKRNGKGRQYGKQRYLYF